MAGSDGMILYGSSLSPYVRKVLVMAAEMGLELKNVPTPPASDDAEFRECSPFGKIPGLRDGDFTIGDSSAIATYLDAKYPQLGMIPGDAQARAKTVWWDEFADTILFATAAKMFFNRIVGPKFMKIPGDMDAADRAEREELPPILDWLDGQIPDSGYLVEDRLTLADIAVASPLVNLHHLGFALDADKRPKLSGFAEAMFAREPFAALIAKETAFLQRFA